MSKTNFTRKYKESKHLTLAIRIILSNLIKEAEKCKKKKLPFMSKRTMAKILGVSPQTVLNEIKRGTVRTKQKVNNKVKYKDEYSPIYGQYVYETNRMKSHNKSKSEKVKEFLEYAEKLILEDKLSPDVVIGRALAMGIFTKEEVVCVNTLYRYIDEGRLKVKNIDLKEKVRRKKCKTMPKENKKILGISIDERPAHIDNREEFGHFEIDTVHEKKGESTCLLTLTERKTRKGIIVLIDFKDSESVTYALKKLMEKYPPGIIKSITADNGAEFSTLGEYFLNVVDVYFAHPYSAFERGGNENFNKLIRQFIPKGTSIDDYNRQYIENIVDRINNTPRKILGYQTANEAFNKEVRAIIKQSA